MRTAIVCAAALAVAGCGGDPKPLSMAATPESSRAALEAALDGWKQGRTYQQMADSSPQLLVRDDDLNGGVKLLDYRIEGEGQPRGTGYSYPVTLTLQNKDPSKPPVKKKVYYNAVSEPSRAIFREDRKP